METHSKKLTTLGAALLSTALLYACGSGDGDRPDVNSANSTVSAYVTDDLAGYQSVEMTLNTVQLRHSGSGRNCEIIKGPLTVDAAELGRDEILEHVDTTVCEAGSYNRLHVELAESVKLVHEVNGQDQTDLCKFVSYYEDNAMPPNRLSCTNGVCALDINGAVNLIAGNHEHVALDADLKEFTVDYGKTPCEATLKVSPLHAKGFDDKMATGYRKSISGYVSGLDTQAYRFRLTKNSYQYIVDYAGVADQVGLDQLLSRAATDQLKTKVRCYQIDGQTSPPTCIAQSDTRKPLKAITVKAKGTVSNLDANVNHTFDLTYGNNTVLPINYAEAVVRNEVEGTLDNGVTAEAGLYGFDVGAYLAREVEVETH